MRHAVGVLLALLVVVPADAVSGAERLAVEGGKLRDSQGRDVMLRGVNLDIGLRRPGVVAEPPFPVDRHARRMRELGFNVVRLQLAWGAIAPGNKGPNDPAICAEGPPQDPGQWDEAHAQAYLDRVEETVQALARHGFYTIFQIAQYGYSERFGGPPSHPDWAVCTSGLPITRMGNPYLQPGSARASEHFFNNDVRGDLQGEYIRMLRALATRFRGNPAVAGQEIYNEPFSPRALAPEGRFDDLVQCFYAGAADPGLLADGTRPQCPPGAHPQGAIPQMRAADPGLVIHPQPHIFTNFAVPTRMGPMPFGNLVFNFHLYCASSVGARAFTPGGVAGGRGPECAAAEEAAFEESRRTRDAMRGPSQRDGLDWFLSEWGFTPNEEELRHVAELADRHLAGWAYFKWRGHEGPVPGDLADPDGNPRPFARLVARPYPAALAGTASSMSYDPDSRVFRLRYRPRESAAQRSVVMLPRSAYGDGACAQVEGARSRLDGDRLILTAQTPARAVQVRVAPGACPATAEPPASTSPGSGPRQTAGEATGGDATAPTGAGRATSRSTDAGARDGALPLTGRSLIVLTAAALALVFGAGALRRHLPSRG